MKDYNPIFELLIFVNMLFVSVAIVNLFRTDIVSSTSVNASWSPVDSPYLDHYTVYYYFYYPSPDQGGRRKRQNNQQFAVFTAGSSSGVIGVLKEGHNYLFSLAVTFSIKGQLFEGKKTDPAPPGGKTYAAYSLYVLSHSNRNDRLSLFFFTGMVVTQYPSTCPTIPATSPDTPTCTAGSSTTPALLGGLVLVLVIFNVVLVVIVIVLIARQR